MGQEWTCVDFVNKRANDIERLKRKNVEVGERLERSILRSVLHDSGGLRRTDSGQLCEFRLGRSVDVHTRERGQRPQEPSKQD